MCEPASHSSHSASHGSHNASQGASHASNRFNVKNDQIMGKPRLTALKTSVSPWLFPLYLNRGERQDAFGFVAPAGFWPRGQDPRRHPRIPRVYTYKEFQNVRK